MGYKIGMALAAGLITFSLGSLIFPMKNTHAGENDAELLHDRAVEEFSGDRKAFPLPVIKGYNMTI